MQSLCTTPWLLYLLKHFKILEGMAIRQEWLQISKYIPFFEIYIFLKSDYLVGYYSSVVGFTYICQIFIEKSWFEAKNTQNWGCKYAHLRF